MIVRPSIQPSSPSRCTKAAVHGPQPEASAPRNPIAGSLREGCARATSSNPPAPQPRRAMISRLFNDRIGPLMVSDASEDIESARTRQEGVGTIFAFLFPRRLALLEVIAGHIH